MITDCVTEYKRFIDYVKGNPVSLDEDEFDLLEETIEVFKVGMTEEQKNIAIKYFFFDWLKKGVDETDAQAIIFTATERLRSKKAVESSFDYKLEKELDNMIFNSKTFAKYQADVHVASPNESDMVIVEVRLDSKPVRRGTSGSSMYEVKQANGKNIHLYLYQPKHYTLDITTCRAMMDELLETASGFLHNH